MHRIATLIIAGLLSSFALTSQTRDKDWTMSFVFAADELRTTGRNSYFILEPGYQLTLESRTERLVITVLDETKNVDNIETRIVEERETKGDQLVEVSRNYFAISKRTNDVFYFGEDVDMYRAGKVVSHEGSWLAGINGARVGMMMPGSPVIGEKYYQEVFPRVAMDRAEIMSLTGLLKTPAGEFNNVLKTRETTPLEPGTVEYKFYVKGIGIAQDGSLKLVRFGKQA